MMQPPFPEHVVLRDFLARLAEELHHLAHAAKALEDRVGEAIAGGAAGMERLPQSLQGLDHLVQTVNELAVFTLALSGATDDRITIPVGLQVREIGLRALAEALVGRGPAGAGADRMTSQGDVDLF